VQVSPPTQSWGRELSGRLEEAGSREWLVTNGIGGFASGTVAGVNTRRYHGLLVAALAPPLGRTLLVSKLDETVSYQGLTHALSTNRWADGTVDPHGYREIEEFQLEGSAPVWNYAVADALLEKRVFMEQGKNTTYVSYRLRRGGGPLALSLKALVSYRDYHSTTHAGDWRMKVEPIERGVRVTAFDGARPFVLLATRGEARPTHDWYRRFLLSLERQRGLDSEEDLLHAATFEAVLEPGETLAVVISTEDSPALDFESAEKRYQAHQEQLLSRWHRAFPPAERAPSWVSRLVLAADQFVVRRPLPEDPEGMTLIAGYPWFSDWGRDTMISLPGLTLSAGRPEIARRILTTFARFVDRGMLPNRFPDAGEAPEYNTVDATLWYFEAVRAYHAATGDDRLLAELFPVLQEILRWHREGTRYGIQLDPGDGLLRSGEPGAQLTWMDAKIGDWVVTPRTGKAVEVNALWYNALVSVSQFARRLGQSSDTWEDLAQKTRQGFQRFWNEPAGYCYDVIDGPEGNDASLRPNQIFAVSLLASPLEPEQMRRVVEICGRHLLTSFGLRSLAPDHPHYRGRYSGGPGERDAVYHQGTVWGWLLGPFALAHFRVFGDVESARSFLAPLAHHLDDFGLGTVAEIFDGDAPHTPRGCFAQAWSVSETLRAWTELAAGRPMGSPHSEEKTSPIRARRRPNKSLVG
jgi:predicted glycogen debranching enzyme